MFKMVNKNNIKRIRSSTITFFVFISSLFISTQTFAQVEVYDLKCEYQTNPLGIDTPKPRLFWKINDSRREATQTAYQVLIATSKEFLENNKADIWNSEKVESDQSTHIEFNGSELKSTKQYFWKVRTWDRLGNVSQYSNIAFWEMGLLNPNDWKTEWIAKDTKPLPETVRPWNWGNWIWTGIGDTANVKTYFRKSFTLPKGKRIVKAISRVTGSGKVMIYLNGESIGDNDAWHRVFDHDFKSYLVNGSNRIAISVAKKFDANSFLQPAFLPSLKIYFADSTSMIITGDKTWKVSTDEISNWNKKDFDDSNWQSAVEIGKYGDEPWGEVDQPLYNPPRSTYVREEFNIAKKVKRARIYVTGLGAYTFHVNGERVGQDFFTPGWTQYDKRIQYQTYDVTSLLKKGDNAIGALLGNVWWSGGLSYFGWLRYGEGPLRLKAQLLIEYKDGSNELVITDKSWKTTDSPILRNNIYDGEAYDARLEIPGWDKPNFDETAWEDVITLPNDSAFIVSQQAPTIKKTEIVKPKDLSNPFPGTYIYDMGQNIVGWVKLKVEGKEGDKVTLRFGELLNKDGSLYTNNLRTAKATDEYILKGDGIEEWEPNFTYHGFRYVEITGYPSEPGLDAIEGQVIHSTAPFTGTFSCSNELINKVFKNVLWGQRGNMMSVPTDCPQRDERLGWTGDAQIFAPTSSYNMEMVRFYSKWMNDIFDNQLEDGLIHNINPIKTKGRVAKPGWGDAAVVVPWVLYQFYGDTRILEKSYKGMTGWIGYMISNSKENLYERSGFGDWVSTVQSPKEPIGSAYFYYSTKLVAKTAKILGKTEDAVKYEKLTGEIAEAFNKKHLDIETKQYTGATQTANLIPLAFGITEDVNAQKVADNIYQNVLENNTHLTTGFLGTVHLLPMLSEYGYHETAYKLAIQRSYPSWGYMIDRGATSMWELWNSDVESPRMNSRNHFAIGSVVEWYYKYLAGIIPNDEAPGFKKFSIAPKPVGDLTFAEATYNSLFGEIKSRWEKSENEFQLRATIPPNTTALVSIPVSEFSNPTIKENGIVCFKNKKEAKQIEGLHFVSSNNKEIVFEVGAGFYSFSVVSEK